MAAKSTPDNRDVWRIFRIMAEFVEGFESLSPIGPAVTIFGSARSHTDDPYYLAAEETARLLVKKKFAVITGGGPGTMEGANKGAFEAGGSSVGLNITLPHEQMANRFATLSLDFHYFYARKVMFLKYASAVICFPGGFGTLDEFFETITLIQTLKAVPVPVVLYGTHHWTGLIEWMRAQLAGRYIDANDLDIFRIVDTPRDAVAMVLEGRKKNWWMPKDRMISAAELQAQPKTAPKDPRAQAEIISGAWARETAEGTRYGRRPRRVNGK